MTKLEIFKTFTPVFSIFIIPIFMAIIEVTTHNHILLGITFIADITLLTSFIIIIIITDK